MSNLYNKFGEVNTKLGLVATELLTKQDKYGNKQLTTDDFVSDATYASLRAQAITKSDIGLNNVINYGVATEEEVKAGTATNKKVTPQRNKNHFNQRMLFGEAEENDNDGSPDGVIYTRTLDDNLYHRIKINGQYRKVNNIYRKVSGGWVGGHYAYLKVNGVWKHIMHPPVSLIRYGWLYCGGTVRSGSTLISGWRVPTRNEWHTVLDLASVAEASNARPLMNKREVNSPHEPHFNTGVHPRWNANSSHPCQNMFGFNMLAAGMFGNNDPSQEGTSAYYFSQTQGSDSYRLRCIWYTSGRWYRSFNSPTNYGQSIRLIRDATVQEQAMDNGTLVELLYDHQNNLYYCIKIGDLVWTVQNLAITTLPSGSNIPFKTSRMSWTEPERAAQNNDTGTVFFNNKTESIWKPHIHEIR